MRLELEEIAEGYDWYTARRSKYQTGQKIPFRVSPRPFSLTPEQTYEIIRLGPEITAFFLLVHELYCTQEVVHCLLNRGKPEMYDTKTAPSYLYIRPDLIINEMGFSMCELETSPFGLALAAMINKAYCALGFETIVEVSALQQHINAYTPNTGAIVYSSKTCAYAGQMQALAETIFSGTERNWIAVHASLENQLPENIYRAFYLSEALTDPVIQKILGSPSVETTKFFPTLTPHMEEKAILALLWDKRWKDFFIKQLGKTTFDHLRQIIPPTFIVGQEDFFEPGLPNGMSDALSLANTSRAKRGFVIKPSGFAGNSSWAEGVHFLHEKSATATYNLLQAAIEDPRTLYVIQEFRPGKKFSLEYEDSMTETLPMQARVRLTPYYAMAGPDAGQLLAAKVTGCEGTHYIHASSSSVNTAVASE
jgi:hypothetical protein